MAKHRFDGRWNYSEMPEGEDVPTPGRQMKLAIPDDQSGSVDENESSHSGFKVDGEVTNTRADLQRFGPGNNIRTLTGTVVFDQRCGDVDHIVIVGHFVDVDHSKLTDQIEGTWVISKP